MSHVFVFLELFSREGGIQSYVKDILQAYAVRQAEHLTDCADVFLLRDRAEVSHPFRNSKSLTFHYCHASNATLGRLKLAIELFIYCLKSEPSTVFCGHVLLAPLVQLICEPLGIPYVVLTYGKEVWEPLSTSKKGALRSASSIWTISRYSRDRACAANGLDRDRFQILSCTVDGNTFKPQPRSQALIEQYQLQDANVLMTVARLWSGDPYKGVDVTIRALPEIARVFPKVKYLVIGRGDDQPRLAKLAEELGVSDRVIFAGFVATEDLPQHYCLADAYVMPSQEGFGIVYLEAMACGIPVLSGDADGSADPLQDGKLGWRVPHRDPAEVAIAAIEMLQGDDRRCDGEWLREQCLEWFDKSAIDRQLDRLLQ